MYLYICIYITAIQKHISYINHVLCFADFATMSKRLGELWATVPTNEKYVSPCMYLHMHVHAHLRLYSEISLQLHRSNNILIYQVANLHCLQILEYGKSGVCAVTVTAFKLHNRIPLFQNIKTKHFVVQICKSSAHMYTLCGIQDIHWKYGCKENDPPLVSPTLFSHT